MSEAVEIAYYDLEQSDGGFDAYGETPQWQWGAISYGPGGSLDGTTAWSTGLAGHYFNESLDYLELPTPDLSGTTRPTLVFHHWYDLGSGDIGWLEIDSGSGSGWVAVPPLYGYPDTSGYTGSSDGWVQGAVSLNTFGDAPHIRFAFSTDASAGGSGWILDNIGIYDGDVTAPYIALISQPADNENVAGPYTVQASISDDVGVSEASVSWWTDTSSGTAPMSTSGSWWSANLPGQPADTTVYYSLTATDGTNTSILPFDGGAYSFRVFLSAPTNLRGPEGRYIGQVATLEWDAPISTHTPQSYTVRRVLAPGINDLQTTDVLTVTEPFADVPLTGDDTFVVVANYDVGTGDPSNSVTLDSYVPSLDPLNPAQGWPGETLHVHLSGSYLLLTAGAVSATMDDIEITEISVADVDNASITLTIPEGSAEGARDLSLTTPAGSVTIPDAFTVLAGDERPRLTELEPAAVTQGETGTLLIRTSTTLAQVPTVDLGDGVLIESVRIIEDTTSAGMDCVEVDYVVETSAPLGAHPARVDDGVRVLTGLDLTIEDKTPVVERQCSTAPGTMKGLGLLLAGLTLLRRRRSSPSAV